MKSSRKSARLSKSREDAAYERRRWKEILDDLSNRPNLERAQAEAIVRKVLALEGATDERKRELEDRIVARFGLLAPVVVLKPAPSPPAPTPAATVPAAAPAAPRRKMAQGVLDPEWLEPKPVPVTSKPVTRRPRVQAQPAMQARGNESLFRELLLRIGLDAGHGVIQDLKRRFALE